MNGDAVGETDRFEYFGLVLQKNGGFEKNVTKNKIKCGWINPVKLSGASWVCLIT